VRGRASVASGERNERAGGRGADSSRPPMQRPCPLSASLSPSRKMDPVGVTQNGRRSWSGLSSRPEKSTALAPVPRSITACADTSARRAVSVSTTSPATGLADADALPPPPPPPPPPRAPPLRDAMPRAACAACCVVRDQKGAAAGRRVRVARSLSCAHDPSAGARGAQNVRGEKPPPLPGSAGAGCSRRCPQQCCEGARAAGAPARVGATQTSRGGGAARSRCAMQL
jgi:hypothetical protein